MSKIVTLEGHSDSVNSVTFSPDSKQLASGSSDTTIKLWSLENLSELATRKGSNRGITSVSFSANGRYLASGSDDMTVQLWIMPTLELVYKVESHTS